MKLATAAVAAILSLTTLVARGAAPADAYSITVQFADLDLDHETGIAKLYSRIKSAARRVCDQQAEDQMASQSYPVCVRRAVSAAVARIDRPMLSEHFAQLGGKHESPAPASVAAR